MNQQQLNKIDEEFDDKFDRFTRIVCMSGDCDDIQNYEEVDYTAEVRDLFHSKLQEAYELGRRDEKEAIIKIVDQVDYNAHNFIDRTYGVVVWTLKETIINKIKSL